MGVSIWQLLIVLVIVVIIFGTKRLRNIGSDLGGAIKSFRGAMQDGGDGHKEGEGESEHGKLAEPQSAASEERKESKRA